MRDKRPAGPAIVCSGLLLACLAIACEPPPPVDTTEDARAGIQVTNARFMELVEAKDAAGLAALYTEDARLLPAGSPPIEGRQAIEQFFAGILQGIARVQLDTVEVEGHGFTAYEEEALAFFDASGARIDEGKAIVIWKQVGPQWKLHRDIFNSNQAPPPPAPVEEAAPAADAMPEEEGAAAPPGVGAVADHQAHAALERLVAAPRDDLGAAPARILRW